ncbi:hypothetical protein BD779DRAFT_1680769 [Infundibulicybe gibba]|nr:hypothetical protein BD779DRAFT_1680769 [Infundibulicybe gibba]
MTSTHPESTPIIVKSGEKRPRIKQAGVAILETFDRKYLAEPNKEQVKTLLAEIRAIPGCEDYKASKLRAWFRRRHQKNKTNPAVSVMPSEPTPGEDQQAYPTLANDAIQHLTVLAQADPSPSPAVVATWAILLKVSQDDINAWLAAYQRIHAEEIDAKQRFSHLPTPISTSPEPASTGGSASRVLVAPKTELPLSPVISTGEWRPTTPCLHRTNESERFRFKESLRAVLAQTITDTTPVPPLQPPSNPAEFIAMFEPYKQKLEHIWQVLEKSSDSVHDSLADPYYHM